MSDQDAPAGIDYDKVKADLAGAAQQDMAAEAAAAQAEAPPQPPPAAAPAPGQVPTEQPSPAAEQQDAVDSFMNIDPATLPPELQAQYKNMQAHFTRTMQDVAPYRDLAQQYGVSAEEMAQAVDFVGRIQSDPAYTQQVYTGLGEYLQQLGYREPQAAPAPVDNEYGSSFQDDLDLDPLGASPTDTPTRPEAGSPLEQRLARIEQHLIGQEQQSYVRELANQIKQSEFAVREADPSLGESDIQRIYELAPSYDGDLVKAAGAYKGWRDDILQSYIAGKATTPVAASGNGAALAGREPHTSAANLREATLRAEEALNQALGD